MFKKKRKLFKSNKQYEESSLPNTLSKEAQQALQEKNLYDDHGPVIIGLRKKAPKF